MLIKMPPLKTLRYGEVISDVNEFIFNDRAEEESIVSDILARSFKTHGASEKRRYSAENAE